MWSLNLTLWYTWWHHQGFFLRSVRPSFSQATCWDLLFVKTCGVDPNPHPTPFSFLCLSSVESIYIHTIYPCVCLCAFRSHIPQKKKNTPHTTQQCLSDVLSSCLHVQTHCPAHLFDAVIYIFLFLFNPGNHVFLFVLVLACTYIIMDIMFNVIIMQCFRAIVAWVD